MPPFCGVDVRLGSKISFGARLPWPADAPFQQRSRQLRLAWKIVAPGVGLIAYGVVPGYEFGAVGVYVNDESA